MTPSATYEEARLDLLDLQFHRYRGGGLVSRYHRSRGLLVIPVMGPAGTPPVVARTHAPIGYREVDFNYSKSGGPPVMPAAADTNSGDLILSEEHSFPAPSPDQNGRLLFGVNGHFTYVQPDGGRTPDDTFPIDSHPFPSQVDALGQYDLSATESLTDTATFQDRVVNGAWNMQVIDSRLLSSYNIIG